MYKHNCTCCKCDFTKQDVLNKVYFKPTLVVKNNGSNSSVSGGYSHQSTTAPVPSVGSTQGITNYYSLRSNTTSTTSTSSSSSSSSTTSQQASTSSSMSYSKSNDKLPFKKRKYN